jgi:hypothetical protein
MLPIEVHCHPAVTAILDFRGIDGGLDLVAAERAQQQDAMGAPILRLRVNIGCPLIY